MFTMVYAVPRGGKREFSFAEASDLAEHVQKNAPQMFAGVPEAFTNDYAEKMAKKREYGWKMPDSQD